MVGLCPVGCLPGCWETRTVKLLSEPPKLLSFSEAGVSHTHTRRHAHKVLSFSFERSSLKKQAMTTISIDGHLLTIFFFFKPFTHCFVLQKYYTGNIFTFYISRMASVLLSGMLFQPNSFALNWFSAVLLQDVVPHLSGFSPSRSSKQQVSHTLHLNTTRRTDPCLWRGKFWKV